MLAGGPSGVDDTQGGLWSEQGNAYSVYGVPCSEAPAFVAGQALRDGPFGDVFGETGIEALRRL